MALRLVAGGYRDTLALIEFDPSSAKLKVVSESKVLPNCSWVEKSVKPASNGSQILYSLSEDEEKGKAFSAVLKGDKIEVTAERNTAAAPCFVHAMRNGSGVIIANYVGGTAVYFPFNADGSLSTESESSELSFPFAYEGKDAPNKERQDKSHLHEVVETESGDLYACDLGSDKIWSIAREGDSGLKIKGYLQCPPGSGPRHTVISPNGKHLYALTELSNELLLFSIDNPSLPAHPSPDFKVSIAPETVPKQYHNLLNGAEIALNPAHPTVIYASNRGELHLNEEDKAAPKSDQPGDTICVVRVSEDGGKVEDIKQIRTGCDFIRGMKVSPDGKFVALAGQKGGGVEIWQISGNGEEWKLAAKEESLESITDLTWL